MLITETSEIVDIALNRYFTRGLMANYALQNNVSMARCYAADDKCVSSRLAEIGNTMHDVFCAIEQIEKSAKTLEIMYTYESLHDQAIEAQRIATDAQNAANVAQRSADQLQQIANTAKGLALTCPADATVLATALFSRI